MWTAAAYEWSADYNGVLLHRFFFYVFQGCPVSDHLPVPAGQMPENVSHPPVLRYLPW